MGLDVMQHISAEGGSSKVFVRGVMEHYNAMAR